MHICDDQLAMNGYRLMVTKCPFVLYVYMAGSNKGHNWSSSTCSNRVEHPTLSRGPAATTTIPSRSAVCRHVHRPPKGG